MRTDGWTDMTKLLHAFRKFGNIPKKFHYTYVQYEDNYISGTNARCDAFQSRVKRRYFPPGTRGQAKARHIQLTLQ